MKAPQLFSSRPERAARRIFSVELPPAFRERLESCMAALRRGEDAEDLRAQHGSIVLGEARTMIGLPPRRKLTP